MRIFQIRSEVTGAKIFDEIIEDAAYIVEVEETDVCSVKS